MTPYGNGGMNESANSKNTTLPTFTGDGVLMVSQYQWWGGSKIVLTCTSEHTEGCFITVRTIIYIEKQNQDLSQWTSPNLPAVSKNASNNRSAPYQDSSHGAFDDKKKLSNCCKKKHVFIVSFLLWYWQRYVYFLHLISVLKNIFNFITSVLESLLSRWGWQNWSWAIGRKHELFWSWKTANNGPASPGQQGGEPDPSPGHGPASAGQGGPDGKENLHFLHQEPRKK